MVKKTGKARQGRKKAPGPQSASAQQRGCPDSAQKELAEVCGALRAACSSLSDGAEDELVLNILRSRRPKP